MDIIEERINDVLVLKIDHYEATIALAGDFKIKMNDFLEKGNDKILLDISKVELMDSTFLGSIIVSLRKMKELGGKIKIFGVGESVGLVFGLTKMQNFIEIFENKEEAINSF